jgi:hypothetical protein
MLVRLYKLSAVLPVLNCRNDDEDAYGECRCLEGERQYGQAEAAFKLALKESGAPPSDPPRPWLVIQLARVLTRQEKASEAEAALKSALEDLESWVQMRSLSFGDAPDFSFEVRLLRAWVTRLGSLGDCPAHVLVVYYYLPTHLNVSCTVPLLPLSTTVNWLLHSVVLFNIIQL